MPDERSRPADDRTASDDLPASGIECDSTKVLALVADSAWQTLTAMLLSAPPIPFAQGLLAQLPRTVPDPVLSWWLSGIRLAVDRNITPNPLTASTAAITGGFPPPPALRGLIVSAGWALSAEASSVPFICAPDLIEIVRAAEVRKAAVRAAMAILAAAWTADLPDLAQICQDAGAVVALVAEVAR